MALHAQQSIKNLQEISTFRIQNRKPSMMPASRYVCSWDGIPFLNLSTMKFDGILQPGDHILEFESDAIADDMSCLWNPNAAF